jgi:hypothetical protein
MLAGTCSMLAATLYPRPAVSEGARRQSVDVRDFGAKGDGVADDTRAIQAAIDHALRSRAVTVHLQAGRYRTTDTLHLGYGETFATLTLTGDGAPYAAATGGTTVLPERIDRPAINVQGARKSAIRDICLMGRNFDHAEAKVHPNVAAGDADPINWLAPPLRQGLRQFAPYAAITVDAYAAPPRPDGYPAPPVPPWPVPGGVPTERRFSSEIEITGCWIGGFAVGIAAQPCDADGNGDFLRVSGTTFANSVYGIAVGNSQSRNVSIRDCFYVRLHTFLTNRHFGRGVGMLGGPLENVSGANSYQLLDVIASRAGAITVNTAYFEAHARIGLWSVNTGFNPGITFRSCTFNMNEELIQSSAGALLEAGAPGAVRFTNCTFHLARRIFHPVRGASYVELDSCLFGQLTDYREPGFYRTMPAYLARALDYTCGGVFLHAEPQKGSFSLKGANLGLAFDAVPGKVETRQHGARLIAQPGQRIVVHHYAEEFVDRFGHVWRLVERPSPRPIDKSAGSPLRAIVYTGPDRIALELATPMTDDRQPPPVPGDIIYDTATATVLAVAEVRQVADVTRLEALQLNNLTIVGGRPTTSASVAQGGGVLWIYDANIMIGDRVLFGDYTVGSPLVTQVHSGDRDYSGISQCLQPGDRLQLTRSGRPLPGSDRPQPYPPGTRILAIDERQGIVHLDRPATSTGRYLVSTVALG